MMRPRLASAARTAAVLVGAWGAISSWGPVSAQPAQAPVFRAETTAVRVDALVTERGRPIAGLQRGDFELRDNGVAQDIASLTTADAAHVILALDVSESVHGRKLSNLVDAARAVFAATTEADRVTVVTFGRAARAVERRVFDDAQRGAAADVFEGGGATSLNDAAYLALLQGARDPRPALMLLLTDGIDNTSWLGDAALVDAVRRADVVVYPIAVDLDVLRRSANVALTRRADLLARIGDISGGRLFEAESPAELRRVFVEVLAEYRQRYIITFNPQRPAPGWHDLDLRVTRRGVKVDARKGYVAPASK